MEHELVIFVISWADQYLCFILRGSVTKYRNKSQRDFKILPNNKSNRRILSFICFD